jgi:hypothetical protein
MQNKPANVLLQLIQNSYSKELTLCDPETGKKKVSIQHIVINNSPNQHCTERPLMPADGDEGRPLTRVFTGPQLLVQKGA